MRHCICRADLGAGDLIGEQGVDLGGFGGGVPELFAQTSILTPALMSSVAWEYRSWWMSISTPAAAR